MPDPMVRYRGAAQGRGDRRALPQRRRSDRISFVVLRSPLFNVVLHEPEIPNNTGNIGRSCVATGSSLHLIRPLGFETTEKACRRAGLDYWPRLGVREHDDWESYLGFAGAAAAEGSAAPPATPPAHLSTPPRMWFFSAFATRPMFDAEFRRGDHLVFGKETAGLPQHMLDRYADRLLLLPMVPGERGLNVATVVCAALYEGVRQLLARGDLRLDSDQRLEEGL